jgi:hypothetical protein
MRFRDVSYSECASNFVQTSDKVRRIPRQQLDKRCVHRKSSLIDTEKFETTEEQSQDHAHQLVWNKDDRLQWKSNSQCRVLLWRFTVNVWKCAKASLRNFDNERTDYCITTMQSLTLLLSPRVFDQKQQDFLYPHKTNSLTWPHATFFSERQPFYQNWSDYAESQAMLNTLTQHDFQDSFNKWQKRWERSTRAEGDFFVADVCKYVQSQFLIRWHQQSRKLSIATFWRNGISHNSWVVWWTIFLPPPLESSCGCIFFRENNGKSALATWKS